MVRILGARHRNYICKVCRDYHPDALKVYYKGTLSYIDGCWIWCGKLYFHRRHVAPLLLATTHNGGNLFLMQTMRIVPWDPVFVDL